MNTPFYEIYEYLGVDTGTQQTTLVTFVLLKILGSTLVTFVLLKFLGFSL